MWAVVYKEPHFNSSRCQKFSFSVQQSQTKFLRQIWVKLKKKKKITTFSTGLNIEKLCPTLGKFYNYTSRVRFLTRLGYVL